MAGQAATKIVPMAERLRREQESRESQHVAEQDRRSRERARLVAMLDADEYPGYSQREKCLADVLALIEESSRANRDMTRPVRLVQLMKEHYGRCVDRADIGGRYRDSLTFKPRQSGSTRIMEFIVDRLEQEGFRFQIGKLFRRFGSLTEIDEATDVTWAPENERVYLLPHWWEDESGQGRSFMKRIKVVAPPVPRSKELWTVMEETYLRVRW